MLQANEQPEGIVAVLSSASEQLSAQIKQAGFLNPQQPWKK